MKSLRVHLSSLDTETRPAISGFLLELECNVSSPQQRDKLADLLEQVVAGQLAAETALEVADSWADMPWKEPEIATAWHTLVHFQVDGDIRAREPEYDAGLRRQLLQHIAKLRSRTRREKGG